MSWWSTKPDTIRCTELIIVPNQRYVEQASFLAHQVLSFSRFEARLAHHLLPVYSVANHEFLWQIVSNALRQSSHAQRIIARTNIELSDFTSGMLEALRELRQGAVTAPLLKKAQGLCEKVRDQEWAALFVDILERVDQQLEVLKLLDPCAIPSQLAQAIQSPNSYFLEAALLEVRWIKMYDVFGLSPARLAWIEALHAWLAQREGGITLCLPTAQAALFSVCGIDDPRERLASRLEERWSNLDSAPMLEHRETNEESGVFAQVAAALFARDDSSCERIDASQHIRRITASDLYIEAETAACEAAAAFREGVSPNQITIALPSLGSPIVQPLLKALAVHGLPVFAKDAMCAKQAPAIRMFLSMMHAVARGAQKQDLVACIRSNATRIPRSRRREIARILEQTPGSDLKRDGQALLQAIPDEMDQHWVEPLIQASTQEGGTTRKECLQFLIHWIHLLGFPTLLERDFARFVQRNDRALLEATAADVEGWRILHDVLQQMLQTMHRMHNEDERCSHDDLLGELEYLLEHRFFSIGYRSSGITLARVRDCVGLSCSVLILVDTHDGSLPARPTPNSWLSRPLREALRRSNPMRCPMPHAIQGAVDLMSAMDAISFAQKRVVLIHRTIEVDGRRLLPGALITELNRIAQVHRRVEQPWAIPPAYAAARKPNDVALALHHVASTFLERQEPPPIGIDVDAYRCASIERAREQFFITNEPTSHAHTSWVGQLSLQEPIRARFYERLRGDIAAPISVTALEELVSCPFVTFARRVLGANRQSWIREDGGDQGTGELAHAALLTMYRALGHTEVAATPLSLINEIRTLAFSVIQPHQSTSSLQRVRRERLVDDVVTLVLNDLSERQAVFYDGEISFGLEGPWPPLLIEDPNDPVFRIAIAGRIDRVDLELHKEENIAIVIDYKTRVPQQTSSAKFFETYRAGSVQLALYAHVVAAALEKKANKVQARFFGYRDHAMGPPIGVSRNEDHIWRSQVGVVAAGEGEGLIFARVREAMKQMRSGKITPRRNWRCEQCEYRSACRAPLVMVDVRT